MSSAGSNEPKPIEETLEKNIQGKAGEAVPSAPPPQENKKIKYAALLVLMLQSSILILTMRKSRVDAKYSAATAVVMNEVLKIIICISKSCYDSGWRETLSETFGPGHWKLAIPAALYTLQNNLQYVAATNLEAATFQVTYQLKILTTAFFAVTILHKRLQLQQWLALLLLTLGVAVVQLPPDFFKGTASSATASKEGARTQVVGLMAVTIACILSGLAGIYFEKVLKKGSKNVSLWVCNIQLSFYSLFPAFFLGCLVQDYEHVTQKGFFFGYTTIVWCVIFLQAAGGIIVALVVKYADNILKNFATSLSILLSAVASYYLFGTPITAVFLLGATMVISSTFWFSNAEQKGN